MKMWRITVSLISDFGRRSIMLWLNTRPNQLSQVWSAAFVYIFPLRNDESHETTILEIHHPL